jgi:hypothetical protein
MPHFFISYSDSECEKAHRLADYLHSQGFDVWWENNGTDSGIEFLKKVEDAIRRSEFLIVLWSREAATSRWVRLEIDIARNLNKRIIPAIVGKDGEPKILTDQSAITPSDFPNLANELKHLLTESSQTSTTVNTSSSGANSSPAQRGFKWSIFFTGVVLGFFGCLVGWLMLAQ